MNPYDPNDALSDKSEEYTLGDTLTTIDEKTEEFPIEELNIKLGCIQADIPQKNEEAFSGEEFVSGEVTSEDTNFGNIRFNDPYNEIDSVGISAGEEYKVTSDSETKEINTSTNTQSYMEELKKTFKANGDADLRREAVTELKANTSTDLIHLLEEAKSLFEAPEKPKVRIQEVIKEIKKPACPMTVSGIELLEIEAKLRECNLVKSQNFCKPDVRLNQLTLRDKCSKPEESRNENTSSELQVKNNNQARNNFCELLYKSAFLNNPEDMPCLRIAQQDQETLKGQSSSPTSEDFSKSNHVDDFAVLSRAVQLLESRTSLQSIPSNCRGLLGILALQQKLKELSNDKEELETRLYKCNSDFMEFIDILSDKARIISINNKEVANFIKILNLKVPEMEKITANHTESLEDIKYRFKERNVAKIIELRKQIEFYTLNTDKLKKKISKANTDNVDIKRQMEGLDIDNLNYKTYFTKKVTEVKANMDNLNSLNSELQRQLEMIQNSDLGKNENFKLKVPALKDEIENISNNIKQVRRDKNKYEMENTELRKKLKQLILAKVMEKRSYPITTNV